MVREPYSWEVQIAQAESGVLSPKKSGGQVGAKPATQEKRDIGAALLLLGAIEGLTKKELAKRCGVGESSLNDWIAGRTAVKEDRRTALRAAFKDTFKGFEGTVAWIAETRKRKSFKK